MDDLSLTGTGRELFVVEELFSVIGQELVDGAVFDETSTKRRRVEHLAVWID